MNGRNESVEERLDRNWNELMQELRVGCLGVFGQRISGLSTLPWPAVGNYSGLRLAVGN